MATPIESFTAVLLQLNMHYKTRVALKLTGIPGDRLPKAKAPSGKPAKGATGSAAAGDDGASGEGAAEKSSA
jgi:hypothetical protein